MRMTRWLVAFLLLCVAGLAQAGQEADQGSEALQAFYNKVHTLSADFQQIQRDDNGNVVQQANGTFLLSRPNKFRWEYDQPYKQIIVSNGQIFKFYDVGLAQVTVRNINATLKATPAVLLTGGEALGEAFEITDGGKRDGLTWVHLTPKADNTDFKSVDLALTNNGPALRKLHDNLGQTTSITFGNVKVNPDIAASKFTLEVPDNVEVVDGRAKRGRGTAR
ncbi:outer membrane lipoprotein chaperone LolA [Salinisphaera sp.]|uniref:outer membrane lipoprotein chaperone LolA n=1 Tax=Salinisphaera sp. TaxID=1914330 RepID=UPI002D799BAC|nr:outer membrane lipoprotein chaperone LolA [Salinisphaera sp.]HET7313263.1 outer membrane lipoprotein chaperone LolA [Salinisphaera sp.]